MPKASSATSSGVKATFQTATCAASPSRYCEGDPPLLKNRPTLNTPTVGLVTAVVSRAPAIPFKKAFFISLTGRNLTGIEAERIGLVSQVVPEKELDGYVDTMAKELASRNPVTLESAKIAAYLQKDLPFDLALQSDDLVQHRMRYYTNPLSDVEGYLHSQKGGGTVKYVKPEDRK